jgi:hypothetical protein
MRGRWLKNPTARTADGSAINAVSLAAGVAGTWTLFLVGYAALSYAGNAEALGAFTTAVEVLLNLAACAAAGWLLRFHTGWRRIALALIAAASFSMTLTDLFWGLDVNIAGGVESNDYADLSFRIPFLIAVLCWLAFWSLVLLRQTARNISVVGLAALASLSAAAIAVFIIAYYPLLNVDTPGRIHVFVLVYASLELVALIICLGAAMLKTRGFPTLLALGTTLIVASDFVFNTGELTGTLASNEWAEVPWILAEVCIAAGVLAFHADSIRTYSQAADVIEDRELYAHNMIPVLLFAALFAAGVLAAFLLAGQTDIRVFSILVLTGVTVVAANRLARLHSEAVRSAVDDLSTHNESGLHHEAVLRAFGSYRPMLTLQSRLRRMQSSALKVSGGFTFNTADTWRPPKPRSLFFIMPYEKVWSDDVHRVVTDSASGVGWSVNRADHRFTEQDLLLNIWKELCRSECVIADITDHTPNVLYEIGLAHAVGKPIVLLVQKGHPIPFDLSVRRAVFYTASADGLAGLGAAVQRLLEGMDEERGPLSDAASQLH